MNKSTLLKRSAPGRDVVAEILKKCETERLPTPLEFLMEQLWDSKHPLVFRKECAKEAAPYIHRKQPQAIDGGETPGGVSKPIAITKLPELSDEQLEQLAAIADRLSDDGGDSGGEGASEAEPGPEDVPGHGGVAT